MNNIYYINKYTKKHTSHFPSGSRPMRSFSMMGAWFLTPSLLRFNIRQLSSLFTSCVLLMKFYIPMSCCIDKLLYYRPPEDGGTHRPAVETSVVGLSGLVISSDGTVRGPSFGSSQWMFDDGSSLLFVGLVAKLQWLASAQ